MAKREMIVSGYTGDRCEEQVDPFLRHLLGQFEDTISASDKLLVEYCATSGMPDLYYAVYDTETYTLSAMVDSGPPVSVTFGYQPDSPFRWQQLRFAFNAAVSLAMEIE